MECKTKGELVLKSNTLRRNSLHLWTSISFYEGPYCKLWTEFLPLRIMEGGRATSYCKDREDEVITSLLCMTGSGTISVRTERLQISEFEIVLELLACELILL